MKLYKDNFKKIIMIKSFLMKLSARVSTNEIIYKNNYK